MTTNQEKLQRSIDDISKCARRHWLDTPALEVCMQAVRDLMKLQKQRAEG